MRGLTKDAGPGAATAAPADERHLRTRIASEFGEMPGLALTVPQAARLFAIEPARCERILGGLVERGVLVTNGSTFARAGCGRRDR